ncbi:MAG TPA: Fe-S cluster assembly protein SufD [Candidatus Binatia bacterium]|nr:Fe-S cluster assembly protein SufD [Candidatus Binatia bacterium]
MSSALTSAPQRTHELYRHLLPLDAAILPVEERTRLLDRFFATPSGREKPGRFWRMDFESLEPGAHAFDRRGATTFATSDRAVLVCDLATAAREHPRLLARAFARTDLTATKFGALATAFAGSGVFVYVPADHACDEPIRVRLEAPADSAFFPRVIVLAERGARATVIERLTSGENAFVCGAVEIVGEENSDITYASVQEAGDGARTLFGRAARPGRDARIAWACAELGAELAAADISVSFEAPGAEASIAALFFPRASQHVDVVSTVEHKAGDATSETLVKSAARERGQARFLGNIRIAPHAQGSDARLRDDALLLSATAHVDSVPALEIGANDVKAYHGATVGALDAEQIFYMESRGIERDAAERMIALGFFEPAIERFPTGDLRDEIRAAVAAKLT